MDDSERDALLARLDERTGTILERLEKGDKTMDDLKCRVGKLESFYAVILAFAGAVSLAVSVTGSWILSKFSGGT